MEANKKTKIGIAKAINVVGYNQISKDIRKAKTKKEVVKNIDFFLISHKCSKTLFDPITRKSSNNPGYAKCKAFNSKLVEAKGLL